MESTGVLRQRGAVNGAGVGEKTNIPWSPERRHDVLHQCEDAASSADPGQWRCRPGTRQEFCLLRTCTAAPSAERG